MKIESLSPVQPTVTNSIHDGLAQWSRTGTVDEPRWSKLAYAQESMPVCLSNEHWNAIQHGMAQGLTGQTTSIIREGQTVSMLVYPAPISTRSVEQAPLTEPEFKRLASSLSVTFESTPFEDGMDHPAEDVIETALQSLGGFPILDWFRDLSLDTSHPSFAASTLRCLGRRSQLGQVYGELALFEMHYSWMTWRLGMLPYRRRNHGVGQLS